MRATLLLQDGPYGASGDDSLILCVREPDKNREEPE